VGVVVSSVDRTALIERYQQGYQAVVDGVRGLSEAELDARPAPGEWTPREIVHHLADSEMTSAIRLRRLLVEHEPVIQGYDERAFAQRLGYAERPIEAALDALSAARGTTAEILARMTDADWLRSGTHTESGRYSAEDWLQIYSAHTHDHAAQINQCLRLARQGKPAA
jgi:hypothetical protein